MNPINNLIGNAGLAALGANVGVVPNTGPMMMHAFDPNMSSSVTLACCQSLCDVLVELPLPSAVKDKSSHTRTLITGGLNTSIRNGTLSDLTVIPKIQQALNFAKQQISEYTFVNSNQTPNNNIVSPSNSESTSTGAGTPGSTTNNSVNNSSTSSFQPPSQLLLALTAHDCFSNPLPTQNNVNTNTSFSGSNNIGKFNNNNNINSNSSTPSSSSTNATVRNVCINSLNDLTADLQTIEPSIDRHTDLPQNLMNDLINDDCDMSSSIHNSNDLSSFHPQLPQSIAGLQPQQHTQAHHHQQQHHHHTGHQQSQTLHHQHHQNQQTNKNSSSLQMNNVDYNNHHNQQSHHQQHQHHHQQHQQTSQQHANHYRNNTTPNNNNGSMDGSSIKREDYYDMANYSSLGERVKSRQREAAQKANQATSAAFQSASNQSFVSAPSSTNSNSNSTFDIPSPVSNQQQQQQTHTMQSHKQLAQQQQQQQLNQKAVKVESNYSSDNDKDWKPSVSKSVHSTESQSAEVVPVSTKRPKPEPSNRPRTSITQQTRQAYSELKPTIRTVKYDYDYSDSMLLNSSIDIVVRFEQIIDEILSTSCNDFDHDDDESDDEDNGYYDHNQPHHQQHRKPKKTKKNKSDSNHMNGMSFDVNITPEHLKEIMGLSAKLKQNNRVSEVERKKIILFLTVLSNQMNIWFSRYKSMASANHEEDYYEDAEEREHYWELCCNASQSALHIMTSVSNNRSDTNSIISHEEFIEVIVDFLSNNLASTTHVTKGNVSNSKSSKGKNQKHHLGVSKRHVTRWTQLLQLFFEFINLRKNGSLTDTLVLSLTRISMSALFLLQNTAEMQFVSIEILCHIFEEYHPHRMSILEELLNSLTKIPTKKSHRKDSVLTQMLVRLTNAFYSPEIDTGKSGQSAQHSRDSLNKQYSSAFTVITGFLSSFFRKCYQNTSNNEVDYKLIFESLLNDLLESMHSPLSTSTIMIVRLINSMLITYLLPNQSGKATPSLTARNLAIEYISIICSKFAQLLAERDETTKELEKTLSTIEEVDRAPPPSTGKRGNKNKDKSTTLAVTVDKSPEATVSKVWNILVDYFNSEKLQREKMVLASLWLREKYFSENEQLENQFLTKLNQTKQQADNQASVVDISTAALCIQYMELVHFDTNNRLFEKAITYVTASLSHTTNTTQRSKAMKCLSTILSSSSVERATQLLSRVDLQRAMGLALRDASTSVREATVDLIGRFVLQSKDQKLCNRYCDLISERILDTGISVRKRVIKILRDFCIEFPEFERCGEIASRIVRRINDDGEGIRRLVVDTCRDLWFSPTNTSVKYRVHSLLHVIATMLNEAAHLESMQSLFDQLMKTETIPIAQQICDCIMTDILIDELPQSSKVTQLSAIQCVSMMAQCCPQLLVKHCETLQSFLSLPCETVSEIKLRLKTIQTIERVLPHVNNPSPNLLTRIEEDLTKNILLSPASIVQNSVRCLAALFKKHSNNRKLVLDIYNRFKNNLTQSRSLLYDGQVRVELVKPRLLRAMFTCALIAKHFSTDIWESKDRLRDELIDFIESQYDADIKCKAISSIGFVIESDPKICLLPNVIDIYKRILHNEFDETDGSESRNAEYCIQVLNNFRNYLSGSIESDEKAVKTIEWSRESLKSMQSAEDDSCSAQSQIIQQYLSSILVNALNPNISIRRVACNVIHVIHSGGHVHPLQLVPHLVAMTSDDDAQIRMRADHVLHEIERKYHGFVAMKAKEAIQLSAQFCKRLRCSGYRVYIEKSSSTPGEGNNSVQPTTTSTKEVCSRLATLYKVICTNRQSRRGFITSLLRHLETSSYEMAASNMNEDYADQTLMNNRIGSERIELEFVVENILFFPYTVYDEIMYILNQLECTSSINSTNITQCFKEIFIVDKLQPDPVQQQQQQQQTQQQQHQPLLMNQPPQVQNYLGYPPVNNPFDPYQNMNYSNSMYHQQTAAQYQHLNYQQQAGQQSNQFNDNLIVDLEDIDLDNEEHLKKYAKNIHVNFDLLLNDSKNERLNNLVRSLRAIYLSTMLRTLLKEFYLLKDEKINDYSAADAKTWEKPVHRRQIESANLKEVLDYAKPQLQFPESLTLVPDLSEVEKQLLEEWKRFKYVSLNNCDPNFKTNLISKLFQVKSQTHSTAQQSTPPQVIIKQNSETEIDANDGGGGEDQSVITGSNRSKRSNNVDYNEDNDYPPPPPEKTSSSKKLKTPSKKSKPKKKRKRIISNEDESSSLSEDDDDDDEDFDISY